MESELEVNLAPGAKRASQAENEPKLKIAFDR